MKYLLATITLFLGLAIGSAQSASAGKPCPTATPTRKATVTRTPTRTATLRPPIKCAAVVGQTCTPPKGTPKLAK
jgi:hypothetical protein